MFEHIINKCIVSDSLICLNLDLDNLDSVIIGEVIFFDSDTLIIDEVNAYGIVIRRGRKISLAKVKLISFGDIYGADLKYLHANIEFKKIRPKYLYLNKGSKSSLSGISESSKNKVVSVFINDDYILGEIIQIEAGLVQVNNVTYQGFEDGYTYVDISLITKIRYDGLLERKATLLKKKKQELGINLNNKL